MNEQDQFQKFKKERMECRNRILTLDDQMEALGRKVWVKEKKIGTGTRVLDATGQEWEVASLTFPREDLEQPTITGHKVLRDGGLHKSIQQIHYKPIKRKE